MNSGLESAAHAPTAGWMKRVPGVGSLGLALIFALVPPASARARDCSLPEYRVRPGDHFIGILRTLGIAAEQAQNAQVWWPIADFNGLTVQACQTRGSGCIPQGTWQPGRDTSQLLQVRLLANTTLTLRVPPDLCSRLGLTGTYPPHLVHVSVRYGTPTQPRPMPQGVRAALNTAIDRYLPRNNRVDLPAPELVLLDEMETGDPAGAYRANCELRVAIGERLTENDIERACVVVWSAQSKPLCEGLAASGLDTQANCVMSPFLARYLDDASAGQPDLGPLGALFGAFGSCRAEGTWSPADFFARWRYLDPALEPAVNRPNCYLDMRGLGELRTDLHPVAAFGLKLALDCATDHLSETGEPRIRQRREVLRSLSGEQVVRYCR